MFLNASTFNQDLCAWGSKMNTSATVTSMFLDSQCSAVGDPAFSLDTKGPFCHICPTPTKQPTHNPTEQPTIEQTNEPTSEPANEPTPVPTSIMQFSTSVDLQTQVTAYVGDNDGWKTMMCGDNKDKLCSDYYGYAQILTSECPHHVTQNTMKAHTLTLVTLIAGLP
jgi:hypothetical protein